MKIVKRIFSITLIILTLSLPQSVVTNSLASPGRIAKPSLSSNPWTTVLTLNPTWDSDGDCEEPFSSGTGYKGIPQWEHHTVDLAAYANKAVKIRFYFDTMDPLYNKFEGWYVDDIKIDGFFDDVESGDVGWDVEGSHSDPSWHISEKRSGETLSHSWLYQDESRNSFQAGTISDACFDEQNWGALTSPVICLGSSPTLEFDTLWEIESVDPDAFDMMYVQIEEIGPGIAPSGLNVCHLEKGDILISHSGGIVTLAEEIAGSYWTHAGMYVGDGQVVEAQAEGMVKRSITQGSFWPENNDWTVLRVNTSQGVKDQAVGYVEEQIGDPYNYDFPFWFTDRYTDDTFYCNQLAWRAYQRQGIDLDSNLSALVATAPELMKPLITGDDLYLSKILGKLSVIDEKEVSWGQKLQRAAFYIFSPADFLITDPSGRRVGRDPVTGEILLEIPGVSYSGPDAEPEFISIPNMEGEWTIEIVGVGSGDYTFLVEVIDPDNHQIRMVKGVVEPGVVNEFQTVYPETTGESIRLTRAMKKSKISKAKLWHFDEQNGREDKVFIAGKFSLPDSYTPADLAGSATLVIQKDSQSFADTMEFKTSSRIWKYTGGDFLGDQGLNVDSMKILWKSSKNRASGTFFLKGSLNLLGSDNFGKREEAMLTLELPVAPAGGAEVLVGEASAKFRVTDLSKPKKPAKPPKPPVPK